MRTAIILEGYGKGEVTTKEEHICVKEIIAERIYRGGPCAH
jgi:hypothetical protein